MNNNINSLDRLVRFILFIVALVLFVLDVISGWVAYTAISIGTIFLLTSIMNFCPVYRVLGINTARKKNK